MAENWLSMQEVAAALQDSTRDNVDLILELRDFIREVAPNVENQENGHLRLRDVSRVAFVLRPRQYRIA